MAFPDNLLTHYPSALRGPITHLGNHGGFSGASLFRIDSAIGALCLRVWPPGTHPAPISTIHALMRRAANAGLDFVPRLLPAIPGATLVQVADALVEMATWMPGTASFHEQPSAARVRAACAALAHLHRAWEEPHREAAPCPALERRLGAVRYWRPLIDGGWRPPADVHDLVAPVAQRVWAMVRDRLPMLPAVLRPWLARPVPLQPCLCDIWHDHVLFTGDRVTGIVDYGSCKIDHVAVDLARLLGSLVGADRAMWAAGLAAYAQHRSLSTEEQALAEVLDRSGAVVAAANWLRWLYCEGRVYPDRTVVARRLAALVQRLDGD